MYQCSLCNFTAHIKQSLTVHIQNHHLSPEKARSARRRNKVGASDQLNQLADAADAAADASSSSIKVGSLLSGASSLEADEMELLRLERMEHDEDEELLVPLPPPPSFHHRSATSKGHNKIKIPQGPARGIKCHLCPFRTASDSELARHLSKDHPPKLPQPSLAAAAIVNKRPVPNLIPISPPAPTTILKIPQISSAPSYDDEDEDDSSILEAVGLSPAAAATTKPASTGKKTSGFLDQLAEKLASSSKQSIVNSEPAVVPAVAVGWSSRCQHCRQRCKTRADLLSHLKSCAMAIEASQQQQQKQQEPHPMENKVFVWNDAVSDGADAAAAADAMMMMMMMQEEEQAMLQQLRQHQQPATAASALARPSSVAGSDISEASLMGVETAPGIGAVTGGAGAAPTPATTPTSAVRRVYRCPQCSFWATTASRFHVHMVGHTNTKPFECSQCAYRSNWRSVSSFLSY